VSGGARWLLIPKLFCIGCVSAVYLPKFERTFDTTTFSATKKIEKGEEKRIPACGVCV